MRERLREQDSRIHQLISMEEGRQAASIRLIPSENYVSQAVMEASGSCLTNKYSEGYPGRRYYEGQQITDIVESLAIKRAVELFGVDHANVQPYSGSVANLAAYNALIEPGETLMGMDLSSGGHLTHGSRVSITSKFFKSTSYTLNEQTGLIDFDLVRDLAKRERPKLIIAGASSYPRKIDFKSFSEIAREVGAFFLADIAHIAGLVVAGQHMSPVPYADIITTTSHKTLRGPRGGIILCKEELRKKVDKAIIPGQQGGPHMHTIAALAVALKEAASPDFTSYGEQIVRNAAQLAERLKERGFNLVTGGTDNHIILIDMRGTGTTGKTLARALGRAGIVANFNGLPGDTAPPTNPNGVRLGTPAVTTRGMGIEEMDMIAKFICTVRDNIDNEETIVSVGKEVLDLVAQFPVPERFVEP